MKFFHTPKNKKFNYEPRYYDEQKEELEARVRQIKREMGVSDDESADKPYTSSIRKGEMRGYMRQSQHTKKKSGIRLVVVLIALLALAYYLLYF